VEDPGTEDARIALAETLLLRARVASAEGKGDAALYGEPAEIYLGLHGQAPGGGEHLERAVRILLEGRTAPGEKAAELDRRAGELLAQGSATFKSNAYFREASHRARLDEIRRLAGANPAAANKMLAAYYAEQQSAPLQPGDSPAAADGRHNDLVTLAKAEKKLSLKAKYRSQAVRLGPHIVADVPVSPRWVDKGGTLYQYDQDGALVRTVGVSSYKWDTNYILDGTSFGGDNIKGLARIGEKDVLSVILKVMHRVPARRGRLSRSIPSAQMFEIGGIEEGGGYLCYRWYYFKAKKAGMLSLKVSVLDVGEYDLDPEAEFVLASIRE
jgi:hypothetical protein